MKRPPIPVEQWVFRDVQPGDWARHFGDLIRIDRATPKLIYCGNLRFRRDTGLGVGVDNPGRAYLPTPGQIAEQEAWLSRQKKI